MLKFFLLILIYKKKVIQEWKKNLNNLSVIKQNHEFWLNWINLSILLGLKRNKNLKTGLKY
jgi:hypothetical protein